MTTESRERFRDRAILCLGILVALAVLVGGPFWTAAVARSNEPVTVVGEVTNVGGARLPQIAASVFRWNGREWIQLNSTVTDAAGDYRFTGLKPGRYSVSWEDDSNVGYLESWYGGSVSARRARGITLAAGQTGRFDGRLVLGGAITGYVSMTDPSRGVVPATEFGVEAYRMIRDRKGGFSGLDLEHPVSSLSPILGGDWRVQFMPTGSYVLRVVDDDENPQFDGEIAAHWIGIPSTFDDWRKAKVFTVTIGTSQKAPSLHVSFTSTRPKPSVILQVAGSDGQPVRGAAVSVDARGSTLYSFRSGGVSPFTDAAGQLRLYRLLPGEYRIRVTARGYAAASEVYPFRYTGAPERPILTVVLQSR